MLELRSWFMKLLCAERNSFWLRRVSCSKSQEPDHALYCILSSEYRLKIHRQFHASNNVDVVKYYRISFKFSL